MWLEYSHPLQISDFIKRVKGRTSRISQMKYPSLRKQCLGNHFWVIKYGVWSIGNKTEEVIKEYLKHHKDQLNYDNKTMI